MYISEAKDRTYSYCWKKRVPSGEIRKFKIKKLKVTIILIKYGIGKKKEDREDWRNVLELRI